MVPTLVIKEGVKEFVMTESMAICEYFEERFPHLPRMLPEDHYKRFEVRRLCEAMNAGT